MPRALEILDVTMRGIERGEIGALEAVDALLLEELTVRESRRIKMAVQMAKLAAIKTLAGFDFAFQPSLDKNRILALAGLQFIDRAEAVHLNRSTTRKPHFSQKKAKLIGRLGAGGAVGGRMCLELHLPRCGSRHTIRSAAGHTRREYREGKSYAVLHLTCQKSRALSGFDGATWRSGPLPRFCPGFIYLFVGTYLRHPHLHIERRRLRLRRRALTRERFPADLNRVGFPRGRESDFLRRVE